MLSGQKPMTFLPELKLEQAGHPDIIKMVIDRAKLDEAVMNGQLRTTSIAVSRPNSDEKSVIHLYCQPNYEQTMHTYARDWKRSIENPEESLELNQDTGTTLGYRDRDVKMWTAINESKLARAFYNNVYVHINPAIKQAYQSQELEKAGIENVKQYQADINDQINDLWNNLTQ